MKKYPKYKPSGVEWIGDIPEHWKMKRIKYLRSNEKYSLVDGPFGSNLKSEHYIENGDVLIIESGFITSGEFKFVRDFKTISFEHFETIKRSECKEGNIIIAKIGENYGMSGILPKLDKLSVISGNSISLTVSPDQNTKFIHQVLLQHKLNGTFKKEVQQTGQPFISLGVVDDLVIPTPPTQEQDQIIYYIGEKTLIIDKLISTKERKIDLLKQQRASLINQVITKGLDPNVKMKDSGVEWIGEIPEHWKLVYLRHYSEKVGSGVTPKGGSETYVDEGIIFIRSQNVHFDGLRLDEVVKISETVHDLMSGSKVQKNDVLLNITGGSIGRCCVVNRDDEMNVNQHVSIIRTKENLLPYFLNYYLSSAIGQNSVEYYISGGNREGLTFESIKCFQIPLPNKVEQQQIIDHLNNCTKEIDDLISLEQKKIALLKEYRQSLISEVITGKIDVRTFQN